MEPERDGRSCNGRQRPGAGTPAVKLAAPLRAHTGGAWRVDPDDEGSVPELVPTALAGNSGSWNRLVDRYTPLVLSIVRRHRLQGSDAEDVVQTVWLRLVEHLGAIRQPA